MKREVYRIVWEGGQERLISGDNIIQACTAAAEIYSELGAIVMAELAGQEGDQF